MKVKFVNIDCLVSDMFHNNKMIAEGIEMGGLYKLETTIGNREVMTSTSVSMEDIWYLRYGNLNFRDLVLLQSKHRVKGLLIFKNKHIDCV